MTTKQEIRDWLEQGKTQDATHVIIACDTFDHEDYPIYVARGEDAQKRTKQAGAERMQRVMEVYALHLDIEQQLDEVRAYHPEPAPEAS